ncbi:HAD family hydrolase [Cellulomonas composti]|uniref:Haloacid dehalogenase n=1 Tax=Cellulomonas composti TaxID=266130 RepID=A0A511JBQ9_9CELL|nr:HAD family hydrolase [Cellulomonas composti]GEL95427.1 haloacid dehalogenase [Cellulomonas composti]
MRGTRLVALDVDGTLMTYDGVISDDVRAAVTALVDAGVHVVLATGRGAHSAVPVAFELGLSDAYVVCSNGAVTVRLDGDSFDVVDAVTFDPGPALQAIALEMPDALCAVEDLGTGYRVSAPFPSGELTGEISVVPFDELIAQPATRVVIRAPGVEPEEFSALVERVGLHEVEYAIGWTAWLDLSPHGVSKATALEEVRRRLGVEPFATVAVGDGGNDLQMLQWAARGVAMGHASAAVRAVADEVTGTIEDDGVLSILRDLLP